MPYNACGVMYTLFANPVNVDSIALSLSGRVPYRIKELAGFHASVSGPLFICHVDHSPRVISLLGCFKRLLTDSADDMTKSAA